MPKVTPIEPALSPQWTAGAQLAIKMLRAIQDSGLETTCIEDFWRKRGSPQWNVVAEYLTQISDDADKAYGFAAMLTQYLSTSMHAGEPTIEYLDVLAVKPPREASLEWDRINGRNCPRLVVDNEVRP